MKLSDKQELVRLLALYQNELLQHREQAEKDRIIESYKDIAEKYKSLLDEYSKKLKFAEAEKEALKSVVRRLSEMTGLTLVEPTQSDKYKEK